MKNHIIELKWTLFYSILSLFTTILCIWLHKEWYWIWFITHLHLDNYTIIVTNMIEGLVCYLRMSIYIGIYMGFISYSILLLLYIKSGQYKYERIEMNRFYLLFISLNIFILPLLLGFISHFLWDSFNNIQSSILVMGKMSELLDTIRNIYLLVWVLFIFYLSLKWKWVQKTYIRYRISILFIIYTIIGLISPPDLIFTLIIFIPIFTLLETGVFINIKTLRHNEGSRKGNELPPDPAEPPREAGGIASGRAPSGA